MEPKGDLIPTRDTLPVRVVFHSYFRDLTGCDDAVENISTGSTLEDLLQQLFQRFPKLQAMRNSTLIAVGVDYQTRDYILKEGDEVSMFPPVQGG
jgi:MoaD family protein